MQYSIDDLLKSYLEDVNNHIDDVSNMVKMGSIAEREFLALKKRTNSIKADSRLVLSYLRDGSCPPVPFITMGTFLLYHIYAKMSSGIGGRSVRV